MYWILERPIPCSSRSVFVVWRRLPTILISFTLEFTNLNTIKPFITLHIISIYFSSRSPIRWQASMALSSEFANKAQISTSDIKSNWLILIWSSNSIPYARHRWSFSLKIISSALFPVYRNVSNSLTCPSNSLIYACISSIVGKCFRQRRWLCKSWYTWRKRWWASSIRSYCW